MEAHAPNKYSCYLQPEDIEFLKKHPWRLIDLPLYVAYEEIFTRYLNTRQLIEDTMKDLKGKPGHQQDLDDCKRRLEILSILRPHLSMKARWHVYQERLRSEGVTDDPTDDTGKIGSSTDHTDEPTGATTQDSGTSPISVGRIAPGMPLR